MKNVFKNRILVIMTMLSLTENIWAQTERILIQDSLETMTEVSNSTLRCSEVGYGARELKINIAALDGWTLFDHTNSHLNEFGEPCMTAGRCKAPWFKEGLEIEDVIKGNPGPKLITINRVVTEVKEKMTLQQGVQVCRRSLREELNAEINGVRFFHVRTGAEQDFPIEVCKL